MDFFLNLLFNRFDDKAGNSFGQGAYQLAVFGGALEVCALADYGMNRIHGCTDHGQHVVDIVDGLECAVNRIKCAGL